MSDANSRPLSVKCPYCGKTVLWTADNPFRPFCNEKCKLIDLGEWAKETRLIPGDPLEIEPDDEGNLFH